MQEQFLLILDELNNLASYSTIFIMMLTLISLLLANLARYAQAKKYGVPLKMVHQASIPDSLDIWITLLCVLGFGMVLPWVLVSADIFTWLAFIIIAMSCLSGIVFSKTKAGYTARNKKGEVVRDVDFKWVFYAQAVLAFTYLHHTVEMEAGRIHSILTGIAYFFIGLYMIYMLVALVADILMKIRGSREILTVEYNEQTYLIAMRHVKNYWVLLPYTIERDYPKGTIYVGGKTEQDKVDIIVYKKGQFIVRDISIMEGTKTIMCHSSHELRGVKGT